MADDKKSPDEYEYPPEEYYKGGEYIPPEEPEPLETEPAKSTFLSRRLLAFVGILLAIGLVYVILMFKNTRRSSTELTQATPSVETGAAAIPSTASAPEQVQNVPPTQGATTAISPPIDTSALAQQNQANQQAMANLQSQIQQLQTQVSDVTNSLATINNQIQVLANELKAITIERSLKGRPLSLMVSGKAYVLKALVPGRAWLQAADGSSTSVTIGDRLQGYGIVQSINTTQGIVTTSSGAIIQYGPRDS